MQGIGGVLAQRIDNEEKPIAYASRTLTKAEQNYSIIELEALAVVYFITLFRPYLLGHTFTVQTDHAPLRWILTANHRNNRLARFSLKLQEYANLMTVDHRPGRTNSNADALSRAPIDLVQTVTDADPNGMLDFIQAQRADPDLNDLINYLENLTLPADNDRTQLVLRYADKYLMRDNCLFHIYQPANRTYPIFQKVVPFDKRLEILEAHHDDLYGGGHLGIRKTAHKILAAYFWPRLLTDVKHYCLSCPTCQARKDPPKKTCAPLVPLSIQGPMDRVAMDIMGPLPLTEDGNRYILVAMCYLTKWAEAIPLPNQTAETIAQVFVEKVICRFGCPKVLLSDRGANFLSSLMMEVCRLMNVRKINTTSYRPQTDGLVERFNRTLEQMISAYVSQNQRNWDKCIPYVLFAYNTAIQESTQDSPYFLLYGHDARLPIQAALSAIKSPYQVDTSDYRLELVHKLTHAWNCASQCIETAQNRQKHYHDRKIHLPTYYAGDLVLRKIPAVPKGQTRKLASLWQGPFRVLDVQLPNVTITLCAKPDAQPQLVHVEQIKHFYGPHVLRPPTPEQIIPPVEMSLDDELPENTVISTSLIPQEHLIESTPSPVSNTAGTSPTPHRYPTRYQQRRQSKPSLNLVCMLNSEQQSSIPSLSVTSVMATPSKNVLILGVLLTNEQYGYLCQKNAMKISVIRKNRDVDIQTTKRPSHYLSKDDYRRFTIIGRPTNLAQAVGDITEQLQFEYPHDDCIRLAYSYHTQVLYNMHSETAAALQAETVFDDFNIVLRAGNTVLPNTSESLVRLWAVDTADLEKFNRFYFDQLSAAYENLPRQVRQGNVVFEPENIRNNRIWFEKNILYFPPEPENLYTRYFCDSSWSSEDFPPISPPNAQFSQSPMTDAWHKTEKPLQEKPLSDNKPSQEKSPNTEKLRKMPSKLPRELRPSVWNTPPEPRKRPTPKIPLPPPNIETLSTCSLPFPTEKLYVPPSPKDTPGAEDVYKINLPRLFAETIQLDGYQMVPVHLFHKLATIERMIVPNRQHACDLHNFQPTPYWPITRVKSPTPPSSPIAFSNTERNCADPPPTSTSLAVVPTPTEPVTPNPPKPQPPPSSPYATASSSPTPTTLIPKPRRKLKKKRRP